MALHITPMIKTVTRTNDRKVLMAGLVCEELSFREQPDTLLPDDLCQPEHFSHALARLRAAADFSSAVPDLDFALVTRTGDYE
jgi:hypothetical protein